MARKNSGAASQRFRPTIATVGSSLRRRPYRLHFRILRHAPSRVMSQHTLNPTSDSVLASLALFDSARGLADRVRVLNHFD
jgi:hypothetical protein